MQWKSMGSNVVLNPIDCNLMHKNSLNILQNIFYVPKKKTFFSLKGMQNGALNIWLLKKLPARLCWINWKIWGSIHVWKTIKMYFP